MSKLPIDVDAWLEKWSDDHPGFGWSLWTPVRDFAAALEGTIAERDAEIANLQALIVGEDKLRASIDEAVMRGDSIQGNYEDLQDEFDKLQAELTRLKSSREIVLGEAVSHIEKGKSYIGTLPTYRPCLMTPDGNYEVSVIFPGGKVYGPFTIIEPVEPPKPVELVPGKFYRTREGGKAFVTAIEVRNPEMGEVIYPIKGDLLIDGTWTVGEMWTSEGFYSSDGELYGRHGRDLVGEWS